MSLKVAYDILVELGGSATVEQIVNYCKTYFPAYYQHGRMSKGLTGLRNRGHIHYNHKTKIYLIVDPFISRESIQTVIMDHCI